MDYEVILTRRAQDDLRRLDRFVQKRIVKKLQFFAKDPFGYSEKLIDSSLGNYRFRIGSYRAIFDVDGNKIIVLRIGHRREIYK